VKAYKRYNLWIAFEKRSYSGGYIGIPTETSRNASFRIHGEVLNPSVLHGWWHEFVRERPTCLNAIACSQPHDII